MGGVAGMSLLWVAYVVVMGRVGGRRLGPGEGWVSDAPTDVFSPTDRAVRTGANLEQDGDTTVGPMAAAVVAGSIALSIAVAKGSQTWNAVVLAFLVAFGLPPTVTWWSRRRIAASVRSRRPSATEVTLASQPPGDLVTPSKPPSGPTLPPSVLAVAVVPRHLVVKSRSGLWWSAIFLTMALGCIVLAATLVAEDETWGVVMGITFAVFFTWVGVLHLGLGITADERTLVVTNFFREVTIPWAELAGIEFTPAPTPLFSGVFHRMVLVTREPRRIVFDGVSGSKEPGHYLHDVRQALIAMRDKYTQAR
jgi:hypothetical protein